MAYVSKEDLFGKPNINDVFGPHVIKRGRQTPIERVNPQLSFQQFKIENYKGIDSVEVNIEKNSLVLLLGLNESGKTTILKAIESFSFMNDPGKSFNPKFFQSIRKKSAVGSEISAVISAKLKIEEPLWPLNANRLGDREITSDEELLINGFIEFLNKEKEIVISRVFPFKNGSPKKYFYRFECDHPFSGHKLASLLAHEIIAVCPFILYFEDFKDRIPEKIFISEKSDSFDPVWYDIINGLYYNTDVSFSIDNMRKFYSKTNPMLDDAKTVETRVNKKLNQTFTENWKDLSGVEEIESTVLQYNHHTQKPHFTLKIKDEDGTTYSVDERSKGALWYLSFLMKTEFRSKKMRLSSGKPVFLIDEPASNLHASAQMNMINNFRTLAENTSIIYTTHSQYLISLENIKNTYVIQKLEGIVHADKWGHYIGRQDAQVNYYQPLANLLNIIPTSFDVPWKKCIITEGPSDRHVLFAVKEIIKPEVKDLVIYPGTSATSLGPIISLNIGWNSNFKVLLDSDKEGKLASVGYREKYGLEDEIVLLPEENNKIEKCFTQNEKRIVRKIVLGIDDSSNVKKKEFAAMWALVCEKKELVAEVKKILEKQTIELFEKLFEDLSV